MIKMEIAEKMKNSQPLRVLKGAVSLGPKEFFKPLAVKKCLYMKRKAGPLKYIEGLIFLLSSLLSPCHLCLLLSL